MLAYNYAKVSIRSFSVYCKVSNVLLCWGNRENKTAVFRFSIKHSLPLRYVKSANQGGLLFMQGKMFLFIESLSGEDKCVSPGIFGSTEAGNVFKQLEDKDECLDVMDGKKLMRKHTLLAYRLLSSKPSLQNNFRRQNWIKDIVFKLNNFQLILLRKGFYPCQKKRHGRSKKVNGRQVQTDIKNKEITFQISDFEKVFG